MSRGHWRVRWRRGDSAGLLFWIAAGAVAIAAEMLIAYFYSPRGL